jgi:hypothetical protein
VTTQKRIEANRQNALRSTGPRTNAGKAHSRHNATKHGLSIPLDRDETFIERIETLTTELMPLFAKSRESVRLVAEQQLEVTRVQETGVDIVNRKLKQQAGTPTDPLSNEPRVASAVVAVLSDLMPLDRYQRRALSKLRKLLRCYEEE